eukprot:883823-Pleurochrysis_carterae.AAC.2
MKPEVVLRGRGGISFLTSRALVDLGSDTFSSRRLLMPALRSLVTLLAFDSAAGGWVWGEWRFNAALDLPCPVRDFAPITSGPIALFRSSIRSDSAAPFPLLLNNVEKKRFTLFTGPDFFAWLSAGSIDAGWHTNGCH